MYMFDYCVYCSIIVRAITSNDTEDYKNEADIGEL